jgi:hypothetical protein
MAKTRRTTKAAKAAAQEEFTALVPALHAAGQEADEKATEIKKAANKALVGKATGYTAGTIVKGISELNLNVGRTLSELSQRLVAESGKLEELQKAIEIESVRLKELHDIDAALVSLKGVLEIQAERKAALEEEVEAKQAAFESDMIRKREEWKREQAEHDTARKKEREREEEEYGYRLSVTRRKEADTYTEQQAALQKKLTEQRAALEREVTERRNTLAEKELEFEDLKKTVGLFPQKLSEAVAHAEQAARAEAKKQAEIESRILQKETEADKKLAALRIKSMEETVSHQAAQIDTLSKQLSTAQSQVQGMAIKAIEGAAGLKTLAAASEIVAEKARTSGQ